MAISTVDLCSTLSSARAHSLTLLLPKFSNRPKGQQWVRLD